jgi:AraC-like DNA-binding protein
MHASGTSLVDLSVTARYFDQAHFTRDFRELTGLPPRRFLREVEHC